MTLHQRGACSRLVSRLGRRGLHFSATALVMMLVLGPNPSQACVGAACLQIWSTAEGGGALTIEYDMSKPVQTYESFCAPDNSLCLYTAIDPGFMAPPIDENPNDEYHVLKDGTVVRVEILSAEDGASMNVNGQKLTQPGESALLGTMPTIHNHPSWQVVAPGGQFRTFNIVYKLTTTSPDYSESQPFTAMVTDVPPPTEGVTPTPTPVPATPCPGDCNADEAVTVNELVICVNMALNGTDDCPACDANGDGAVTVNEIVAAVNAALVGCSVTPPVSFAEIQQTIFTPRCATQFCHDAQSATGSLDLSEGTAYGQLVGVPPSTFSAQLAGLLRVDPGHPENSFLLVKVVGPSPAEGSRMPLTGAPLTADEIQLIRDWIIQGAKP